MSFTQFLDILSKPYFNPLNHFLNLAKRPNAGKLAVILSDGRVSGPVDEMAEMLRSIGVEVIAVSLNEPTGTDERELAAITRHKEGRVFTKKNMQQFEDTFLAFVGFGCEGIELGTNASGCNGHLWKAQIIDNRLNIGERTTNSHNDQIIDIVGKNKS